MVMPSDFLIEEQGPNGWGVTNKLNTPPFAGGTHSNQGFALHAQFTRGGIHTITFQLSPVVKDANQAVIVRAVADITWSVAGVSVSRTAHVGSGTSISGIGEAVTCRLRDDSILSPDAVEPLPVSFTYPATMIVTAGVRAPSPNPPYYAPSAAQNFKYQAGDPETIIEIPPDAGVNSFYLSTNGDDIGEDFVISGFPKIAQWDGRAAGQWIPLHPGIRKLAIRNMMATDIYASVLFGIDG